MPHIIAEERFKRCLNDEEYEHVERILRDQYDGDIGYNPGSQLIQIAGISVLDDVDHYIKEQLRAHFYIRYMDDFLILSNSLDYLKYCFKQITEQINGLGFELNPKKSRIFRLKDGIGFLGFDYRLTDTGMVIKTVKSECVKRERKKLLRLVRKSKDGLIPREKVDESYRAWKNHVSYGNSHNLIQRMDKYYSELWGDNHD